MERDPGLLRAAALVMLLVLILGAGASASSSATTTITGTILPKNPITVAFTGTPLSGCAPLKVRFTDLSTSSPPAGKIRYREWTFFLTGTLVPVGRIAGTGNSQRNPSYTFKCPGVYDVNLTVCDRTDCSGYNNSLKKVAYICAGGPDYPARIDGMRALVISSGLDTLPEKWFFDPEDLLIELDAAKAEFLEPGCSSDRIVQHLDRFLTDLRYVQSLYRLNAGQKAAVKYLRKEATGIIDTLSACPSCPVGPVTCGSLTC
jgi:hypothetical protein